MLKEVATPLEVGGILEAGSIRGVSLGGEAHIKPYVLQEPLHLGLTEIGPPFHLFDATAVTRKAKLLNSARKKTSRCCYDWTTQQHL